jgi:hypothetical protein
MYHVDRLLGEVLDQMVDKGELTKVVADQIQSRLRQKIDEYLEGMTKK